MIHILPKKHLGFYYILQCSSSPLEKSYILTLSSHFPRLTDARALAILEMLKCKSDKTLMKMKYAGGWLDQRTGSFTKAFRNGWENLEDRPVES
ncbi:MAG TPA: hypothetical protein DEA91_19070 [Paenibacillus sp.]|nr:hypothetical protein [Paenibacillus sp.]